jgi:hypothetical protein
MGWTETRAALQFPWRVVAEVDPVVEGQEKCVGISADFFPLSHDLTA